MKTVFTRLAWISAVALMVAVLGLGGLASRAQAQRQSSYCYRGNLTYTNTTAAEQTIYLALYDPFTGQLKGDNVAFTKVAAGETFNGAVEQVAPDGTPYVFLFGVNPLAQTPTSSIGATEITPCQLFNDGRLNWRDAAAPVVVYFPNQTQYEIWGVNPATNNGTRILTLDPAQTQRQVRAAIAAGENAVIAEAPGVTVYALSGDGCQVNAFQPDGKLYSFLWLCNPSTLISPTPTATPAR
jgi:hypothetical protein